MILGYNDDPVVPGKDSAIFMHVAKPGYIGTGGCIAFSKPDLWDILRKMNKNTKITVHDYLKNKYT
jgi:L,D-peptidoglycan transpeptidase YkuD (ErfK/YbiS/YcfS/YnhG family)